MRSLPLRSSCPQILALAIFALAAFSGCSKSSSGGGDSGSSDPEGVNSGAQPGQVAVDTSDTGSATPTSSSNSTPASKSSSSKVNVSGTLQVANDPGLSLVGPLDGMYVKAMTADITNQVACLGKVNASSGNFGIDCDGFQNKQLVVAIIHQNSNGTSDLLALKFLGGIAGNTTSVSVDLTLDVDTGTLKAENFVQTAAESVIAPGSIKVAVSNFFSSLVVQTGLFSLYKTHVVSDVDKHKVLAGDYSTLPDYASRTAPGVAWRETQYAKYFPSDGFVAPRLQLWVDADKEAACHVGYSITDGTSSLTDMSFTGSLAAIKSHNWAPQAVLNRYYLASLQGQGTSLHGDEAVEGRRLVEEFYQKLSESRKNHSPDITKSLLANTYTALTLETSITDVTDETLKIWGYMMVDHAYVHDDRRPTLKLALASFSTVDADLGGTGKSVLQKYVKSFMLASAINAVGIKVYGGSHFGLNTALDLSFAQEAKLVTADAATVTLLNAAIAKLQNSDPTQQHLGSVDVHAFLDDTDFAANIINSYCYDAERFDFTRVVGDPTGRAALATFESKVNMTFPPTLKGGVVDPLFRVVGDFVAAISPIAGGCSQLNLTNQYAWSQRAIWNSSTQSYDTVTNDSMRDIGGKDTIMYMWNWLRDLRRRAAIYGIDLRDPNQDGVAAFNSTGSANGTYSLAAAQADFDALANGVLALIALDDQWGPYQNLCDELAKSGFDVTSQSQCVSPMAVPSAAQALTSAQKLAKLQDVVVDLVSTEAYRSDPGFRAKMDSIYKNSACPPDVTVSWDKDSSSSATAFALEIKGPVYRILDGVVTSVEGTDGKPELVVDGSHLQTGKVWIPSQSIEKDCVYGDVKFLRNVEFETDHTLKSFVFENGFKDTCYDPSSSGGTGYVDDFFVDVTSPL